MTELIEFVGGREYRVPIEKWAKRNGQAIDRRVGGRAFMHRKRYRIANKLAYGKGAWPMKDALRRADDRILLQIQMAMSTTYAAYPQRYLMGIGGLA